ncbi:MAG: T9SS type A sorting domain-containing protein [Bacteroidetes bacterium]|nr:T9SS type A sorting domain-containing protein [Bacteroidota bacterium]
MKKKQLLSILFLGLGFAAFAQSNLTLIKDINTSTTFGIGHGDPSAFTVMNNKLYFLGNDGVTPGEKIFVTDPTNTNTEMIGPVAGAGTAISNITAYNNKLYFYFNDGINGLELWSSDGTTVGTSMFNDFRPGLVQGTSIPASSTPENLTVCNNLLFFTAFDGTANFAQLFVTDGTLGGTIKLGGVAANAASSGPSAKFMTYNNKIYFTGNTGSGYGFWESDGTVSGTKLITGSISLLESSHNLINDALYFYASNTINSVQGIYKFDNTSGLQLLKDTVGPSTAGSTDFIEFNGQIFISGYDLKNSMDNIGHELWVSDGTPAGTKLFKDINVGNGSSRPYNFTIYNSELYFLTIHNGGELWKTDGSLGGTVLVKTSTGGSGRKINILYNKMYFGQAYMWESDGTPSGTFQITPTITLDNTYAHYATIIINDELYFDAYYLDVSNNSSGLELCKLNNPTIGINEAPDLISQISVYPNPSNEFVTVEFFNPTQKNISIIVSDILGKQTIQKSAAFYSAGKQSIKLNVNDVPNGIWLISVEDEASQKITTQKIVIQK